MKNSLFKLAGLLLIAVSLGLGWVATEYRVFSSMNFAVPAEGTIYEIKPGAHLTALARDLEKQGIISNARYLRWYARLNGRADRIQAGDYLLTNATTPALFLDMINTGKVMQYSLTIVEGWTFKQMLQAIREHDKLQHTLDGLSDGEIMARLGRAGEHPEGRFLPDTYLFPRNTSDEAFLLRAYQAMEKVLAEEWQGKDEGLPYKDPYEALIMASIIEKETAVADERFAISGVFVRRLQKGMRLQTDPTVIYGMGEDYDGNIRRRDLLRKTPYNTYRINGLPPTPIALPSVNAINAALHPDDSGNLYFVARGDGSHEFSATLTEHNENVIKYQLNGRRKSISSMPVHENRQ